jgi:histidinol-phosphatase
VTDAPWSGSPWADDLALALALADVADGITMERFGSLDLRVETKPDLTPVSDADQATEVRLRAALADARPGDAVVGEEYGVSGESDRHWVLDPIDGTKNYVRGVPVWATLIALTVNAPSQRSEDVVVGVVSAPALGRRWWAARGGGAWLDAGDGARPLAVSGVTELGDASVSFSEWNDPAWEVGGRRRAVDALLRRAWRSRAYGDFWSHMMVAEGSVDVAVEPQLSGWDMAALIPVVEEAGGAVTALDGRSPMVGGNALSSNGRLHPGLLEHFGESPGA